MDARKLGTTDIEVSPIGLGCWQFSQGKGMTGRMWSVLDQGTMDAIVDAALRGGVSWFDTAQAYGNGASERALSAALQHRGVEPGTVVVATKWLPIAKPAGDIPRTIGTRIACLQPYPIDLFQVHSPGSLSSIPAQMREMAKLVRAGSIRAVGVSNFSAKQMARAAAALRDEGLTLADQPGAHQPARPPRRVQRGARRRARAGRHADRLLAARPGHPHGALPRRSGARPGAALGPPLASRCREPLPHARGPGAHGAADRRAARRRRGARRLGGPSRPGVAGDPLRRHGRRHTGRLAAGAGDGSRGGHGPASDGG